ncbi:MAG TPA: hypothetical protein VHV75_07610 [Solirubrobacteraceae bacterium]|jgi:DNA-binding transcriptional ArsR family regulator|nr:hypothetical protein [Solirubrobacteraceae bacterium]
MARDSISITEADRSVLGPLAEHRILIVSQVASLLGVSEGAASRRLQRLKGAGLVHYERVFHGAPAAARITSRGLHAIEHSLRTPNENLHEYRHDVGVGWLWLAARAGAFGAVSHVAADREMRAADGSADAEGRPATYGVGLGMIGSRGRPQRHYPDLILDMTSGHEVAVELELTQKSSRRMARIMTAYASDARVDAVLYLVPNRAIAELVSDAARRAGIADMVHVQRIAPDGIAGSQPRSAQRTQRQALVAREAER